VLLLIASIRCMARDMILFDRPSTAMRNCHAGGDRASLLAVQMQRWTEMPRTDQQKTLVTCTAACSKIT
jgi:hypothetical protein